MSSLDFNNLSALSDATLKNKQGEDVALDSLLSNDLVGLYFSAHWCPPCRGFTPQLAKTYNDLKAADKKVEIVFVSSDSDQGAFDEYFGEMPWIALDYKQRDLKATLSDAFDVSGIPTLVFVDPTTGKMNMDGREAVGLGTEYFPWSDADMARGAAEAEEKERKAAEEAKARTVATQQSWRDANTVVINNHRGVGAMSVDYTLEFEGFNTFAADCKLSGGKFYYEVECVNIQSVPQMGWYTEGFEAMDESYGEGIGDDAASWGTDGVRQAKWHNGSSSFGSEWANGDIIGFAADLDAKTVSFSYNGSWAAPDGVAFEGVAADWIAPGLTAQAGTYRVNFGDRAFKHSAPDSSYASVHATAQAS